MIANCFICNIERGEFDRWAEGFQKHIKGDHNLWKYVYLLTYLRIKERTEMTGTESFLAAQLEDCSTRWFPQQAAMCLEAHEASDATGDNGGVTTAEGVADELARFKEAMRGDISRVSGELMKVRAALASVLQSVYNGSASPSAGVRGGGVA
jgi:hypothetical protein